jgi:hypothetical protein
MELFIPSLVALLLGAAVFFVLLPKMSPYMLGLLAAVFFVVGAYQHYQMFPYEYSASQLKFLLQDYAPFAMLIAVILGLIIAIMTVMGGSAPAMAAALPAMPSMPAMPSLPSMPAMPSLFPATAGSNKVNLGGNAKRNNLASSSFKVV